MTKDVVADLILAGIAALAAFVLYFARSDNHVISFSVMFIAMILLLIALIYFKSNYWHHVAADVGVILIVILIIRTDLKRTRYKMQLQKHMRRKTNEINENNKTKQDPKE